MQGLFELKQERKEHAESVDRIMDDLGSGRTLSTPDQVFLEKSRSQIRLLDSEIAEREGLNTIRQFSMADLLDGGRPNPEPGSRRGAGNLAEAMQSATPQDREQLRAFANYLGGDMTALADLTPGGDGGVFIPTMVAAVVERAYSAFTPVVNACRVWPTPDGEPTKFPVISDSESAVILAPAAATGADATVSGNHPPTAVGGPTMGAYKFSSLPVFLPRETITDSQLNVLDEILGALLSRILRLQNLKYTKGSGTNEPTGYMTSATSYAAGSVALDLDIALDLAYSVPQLYRPNGSYMATDTTIKYLRKLKTGISGDKRGLWKDAFEEGNATLGTPAKLHGWPIFVNNDMDSVATDGTFAGVSPLAFGDFKKFVVRDAEMGSPYVYRYTVPAKDGGAVIAFQRSDSRLIVNTAISKLTVS